MQRAQQPDAGPLLSNPLPLGCCSKRMINPVPMESILHSCSKGCKSTESQYLPQSCHWCSGSKPLVQLLTPTPSAPQCFGTCEEDHREQSSTPSSVTAGSPSMELFIRREQSQVIQQSRDMLKGKGHDISLCTPWGQEPGWSLPNPSATGSGQAEKLQLAALMVHKWQD